MQRMATIVAFVVLATGLAGCEDAPSDGSGMPFSVTPGDDARSDPYVFRAHVDADTYLWDFADGIRAEGREVDHLFGFSDGVVRVRLTACTGSDCQTYTKDVDLGGIRNSGPQGRLVASTQWPETGETVAFSVAGSTDPNGDPLLVTWTCERLMDLKPGKPHPDAVGGVPFGVNFVASIDASVVPSGTVLGQADCTELGGSIDADYARDATEMQITIDDPGVYRVQTYIQDPKGAKVIGRLDVYVDPDRPDTTFHREFEGRLDAGASGVLQAVCTASEQECPVAESVSYALQVPICIAAATITFTSDPATDGTADARFTLHSAGSSAPIAEGLGDSTVLIGTKYLCNGNDYVVDVGFGGGVMVGASYKWSMDAISLMDPKQFWAEPTV